MKPKTEVIEREEKGGVLYIGKIQYPAPEPNPHRLYFKAKEILRSYDKVWVETRLAATLQEWHAAPTPED